MKIFLIYHTQIAVESKSICVWIVIAEKHLRFLQTKHLQCRSAPHIAKMNIDQNCKTQLKFFISGGNMLRKSIKT